MKLRHLLYVLSPLLVSFIFIFFYPLNNVLAYALSSLFILFWFFVGTQFAIIISNRLFFAIIIGNFVLLIDSIVFLLRNLNVISLGFLPDYLFDTRNKILYPLISNLVYFIQRSDNVTMLTNFLIQYISLAVLILCFSIGYVSNRSSSRKSKYQFSKQLRKKM